MSIDSAVESLIKAWEKTVDVQQHFNDLSLRVRNFAITVLTAVLGGAALAFKETPHLAPWILAAGVIAWLGFYMMDALWYHRLLLGSVAHGEDLEGALAEKGLTGFALTKKIREKSAISIGKRSLRSVGRLNLFYFGGLFLFSMLGLAAWLTGEPGTSSAPAVTATALSSQPKMRFPPDGAVLRSATVAFGWDLVTGASHYVLEVETQQGKKVLSVVLPQGSGSFMSGSELTVKSGKMRWRSVPLDGIGQPQHQVSWTVFEVAP